MSELEHWTETHLKKLLDAPIRDFGSFSMTNLIDFVEDGVPFIKSESVKNGKVDKDRLAFITNDVHKLLHKSEVRKGDILFTKIGAMGRVALYDGSFGVCNSNAATAKIKINESIAEPKFIVFLLSSEKIFREFEKTIISTPPRINLGDINSLRISYPPLPQQKKIAKILTTVDSLIEKTQALIDKYIAIKQGMMADLFTRGLDITGTPTTNPLSSSELGGQLRPSVKDAPELYKETELGWVPKEWESSKLSDGICDFIDGDRGHNYPSQQDFFNSGHCLFLSAKNVTKRGFNWSEKVYITREKHESLNSGSLNLNDIVITTRGTVGNIALLSQMPEAEAVRVNSGMLILRCQSLKVLPEFAYHFLSEWGFNRQHQKLGSGSAQPQLPSKDLKQFLILIPSLREQECICSAIQNISRKLLSENKLLNKLRLHKKGLMQDLLTGKVPVNA